MDGRTHKPDAQTWLPLVRQRGDETIGQSLMHLARLAAATDQAEADPDLQQFFNRFEAQRSNGLDCEAVAQSPDSGPFRKEVDR